MSENSLATYTTLTDAASQHLTLLTLPPEILQTIISWYLKDSVVTLYWQKAPHSEQRDLKCHIHDRKENILLTCKLLYTTSLPILREQANFCHPIQHWTGGVSNWTERSRSLTDNIRHVSARSYFAKGLNRAWENGETIFGGLKTLRIWSHHNTAAPDKRFRSVAKTFRKCHKICTDRGVDVRTYLEVPIPMPWIRERKELTLLPPATGGAPPKQPILKYTISHLSTIKAHKPLLLKGSYTSGSQICTRILSDVFQTRVAFVALCSDLQRGDEEAGLDGSHDGGDDVARAPGAVDEESLDWEDPPCKTLECENKELVRKKMEEREKGLDG